MASELLGAVFLEPPPRCSCRHPCLPLHCRTGICVAENSSSGRQLISSLEACWVHSRREQVLKWGKEDETWAK